MASNTPPIVANVDYNQWRDWEVVKAPGGHEYYVIPGYNGAYVFDPYESDATGRITIYKNPKPVYDEAQRQQDEKKKANSLQAQVAAPVGAIGGYLVYDTVHNYWTKPSETPTTTATPPEGTAGDSFASGATGERAPQVSVEETQGYPGGSEGAMEAGGEYGGGARAPRGDSQAPQTGGTINYGALGAGLAGSVAGGYLGQQAGEAAGLSPQQSRGTAALGAGAGGGAAAGYVAGTGAGAGALAGGVAAAPVAIAMFAGGTLSDKKHKEKRPFIASEVLQNDRDLLDMERNVPGFLSMSPEQQAQIANAAQNTFVLRAIGKGKDGNRSVSQEGLSARQQNLADRFGGLMNIPLNDPVAIYNAAQPGREQILGTRATGNLPQPKSAREAMELLKRAGYEDSLNYIAQFQQAVRDVAGDGDYTALGLEYSRFPNHTQEIEAYKPWLDSARQQNVEYINSQIPEAPQGESAPPAAPGQPDNMQPLPPANMPQQQAPSSGQQWTPYSQQVSPAIGQIDPGHYPTQGYQPYQPSWQPSAANDPYFSNPGAIPRNPDGSIQMPQYNGQQSQNWSNQPLDVQQLPQGSQMGQTLQQQSAQLAQMMDNKEQQGVARQQDIYGRPVTYGGR